MLNRIKPLEASIKIFFVLFLILNSYFLLLPISFAQENLDLTYTYKIADTKAQSGDILLSSEQGLKQADVSYSNRIFGILQQQPTVVFRSSDDSEKPAIRAGTAIVNVSNLNGPIKKGDFITSSPIPGKGQKGTQSGYTLGIALADFDGNNGDKTTFDNKQYTLGQIPVAIKIEYTELTNPRSFNRILDLFNLSLFQNLQDSRRSVEIVKYIAALIVFVASVILGFVMFARSIPKSIEAIGRNPLARKSIQFSIILSVILTTIACLIGVGAAFLIIKI